MILYITLIVTTVVFHWFVIWTAIICTWRYCTLKLFQGEICSLLLHFKWTVGAYRSCWYALHCSTLPPFSWSKWGDGMEGIQPPVNKEVGNIWNSNFKRSSWNSDPWNQPFLEGATHSCLTFEFDLQPFLIYVFENIMKFEIKR